jgi:hemerythrin-like metal-binding protein
MAESEKTCLGSMFYTGSSRFLEANEHFTRALIEASSHCAIHASEDIFDANGLKLWARGQPIGDRLLERLSNRRLRKPIELCVYAADPVATAGIAGTIEYEASNSPDLGLVLGERLPSVLEQVRTIAPNPTELMLLSVMRYSGRDMLEHAALVCAVALAAAELADVHPDLMRIVARAALLHDVGELYLPPDLFESTDVNALAQVREIRKHALIGAQVAVELARAGPAVGHLIGKSHERLDGWGYPGGLKLDELSRPAQALLFSEAMVNLIGSGRNGLKRAAVAARLVPGEFPREMVSWIVRCASTRPAAPEEGVSATAIEMDLLQIQALLTRLRPLLMDGLSGETVAVRSVAVPWSNAIDGLINELRRTGIESAISCGMSLEPQNDAECIELSVLSRELLYRVRELRLRIELAQSQSPELATSALVLEVLELLRACERSPEPAGSAGGHQPAVLSWSKLYCVGLREIDDQHRVLVGLLNRLGAANSRGDWTEMVSETLASLVKYVGEHFAYEEQLMKEHGYEETASHVAAHVGLARRVGELVGRENEGSTISVGELTVFLRQWLIAHILHTDRALGAALNAKGVH